MRVYWTAQARTRLLEIQTYIAQDSPQAAHAVVARLLQRAGILATPPHTGRRLPEYRDSETDLREILERPFRIIYRVTGPNQVEVITVFHFRQRLPRDPKRVQNTPSG